MDAFESRSMVKPAKASGGNRHVNNNFRIFVAIIGGFLTINTIINMQYHRKFNEETGARKAQLELFKMDQANKLDLAITSKDKSGSESLIDEGRSKEESTDKKHVDSVIHLKEPSKVLRKDPVEIEPIRASPNMDQSTIKSLPLKTDTVTNHHTLGGLSCAKHGGASDKAAADMVYWSDIPSDSSYVSPFKKKQTAVQYMTFEPDGGGWNNIRMAMETVVVMAHAMGRTLVLPPGQRMYLLGKNRDKQKTHFSFADFFHLDSINLEHAGIDIISTEEFLLREAMTGNLKNKTSGLVSFPPFNRTNWDGEKMDDLKKYLRDVTLTPLWAPANCMAAFPASTDLGETDGLNTMIETLIKDNEAVPDFLSKPTPVDAAPIERMKEMRSDRRELCIYDEDMQNAPVLHFMCYHKMRVRLLVHFYAFLFFEDWKQQLWTNRFVRDHLRYIDELQCIAARVVEAIREKAKTNGDPNGLFDTFHVRRGDFQYKATRVDAEVLYKNSADLISENTTLYIATDERDKKFFDPIKQHYKVYFLDDFKDLYKDLNTNYYGMLDQLIASKGRTFVGTFHSTFTGYINRMRGYHAQKYKLKGYDMGTIESYYFVPLGKKYIYQKYGPVKQAFYSREFPVSWRDIDKGIDIL